MRLPSNAKNAPCGSKPWTIQPPPGTWTGPCTTLPPPDVIVDVADVEVIVPEGGWQVRRLRHHAANVFAVVLEQLVFSHGAHVHRLALRPAEHFRVKGKDLFHVFCVELAPADATRRVGRRWFHNGGLRPFEELEVNALRIGYDREAAYVGNVSGLADNLAAEFLQLCG